MGLKRTLVTLVLLSIPAILANPWARTAHEERRPRIVGGRISKAHSAPFMALLVMDLGHNTSICGGSLLSNRLILTAAHCLESKSKGAVFVGVHSIEDSETERQMQIVNVTNYIFHGSKDVAMISLPRPINFTGNPYISTVTLPTKADENKVYPGEIGRAFGWGTMSDSSRSAADALHHVDVTVCRSSSTPNPLICTEGTGRVGTCEGDSGGPLIVNGVQIGVTSFGPEKCESGSPSFYVSVNKIVDWIETVMRTYKS